MGFQYHGKHTKLNPDTEENTLVRKQRIQ